MNRFVRTLRLIISRYVQRPLQRRRMLAESFEDCQPIPQRKRFFIHTPTKVAHLILSTITDDMADERSFSDWESIQEGSEKQEDEGDADSSPTKIVVQFPPEGIKIPDPLVETRKGSSLSSFSVVGKINNLDINSATSSVASASSSWSHIPSTKKSTTSSISSLISSFDILAGPNGKTVKRCQNCTFLNSEESNICQQCRHALVANPCVENDELLAYSLQKKYDDEATLRFLRTHNRFSSLRQESLFVQAEFFTKAIMTFCKGYSTFGVFSDIDLKLLAASFIDEALKVDGAIVSLAYKFTPSEDLEGIRKDGFCHKCRKRKAFVYSDLHAAFECHVATTKLHSIPEDTDPETPIHCTGHGWIVATVESAGSFRSFSSDSSFKVFSNPRHILPLVYFPSKMRNSPDLKFVLHGLAEVCYDFFGHGLHLETDDMPQPPSLPPYPPSEPPSKKARRNAMEFKQADKSGTAPFLSVDSMHSGSCAPTQEGKESKLLSLLIHSAACKEVNCKMPGCRDTKRLWCHVKVCGNTRCIFSKCMAAKRVLRHFKQCQDPICIICRSEHAAPEKGGIDLLRLQSNEGKERDDHKVAAQPNQSRDEGNDNNDKGERNVSTSYHADLTDHQREENKKIALEKWRTQPKISYEKAIASSDTSSHAVRTDHQREENKFSPVDSIQTEDPLVADFMKDHFAKFEDRLGLDELRTDVEWQDRIFKLSFSTPRHTDRAWDRKPPKPFVRVAFNPKSALFASSLTHYGSRDNSISLWKPKRYKRLARMYVSTNTAISCLEFSPNGNTLAAGFLNGSINLYSGFPDGTGVGREPEMKTLKSLVLGLGVLCVAFSPDSRYLVSGYNKAELYLWRVSDGKRLQTCVAPWSEYSHSGITDISFGGEMPSQLTVSSSEEVLRYVIRDDELVLLGRTFLTESCFLTVSQAACVARVKTGDDCRSQILLSLLDEKSTIITKTLEGSKLTQNNVVCLKLSPRGTRLASGEDKDVVRVWNVRKGGELEHTFYSLGIRIVSLAWFGENTLACGTEFGYIHVWNLNLPSHPSSNAEASFLEHENNTKPLGTDHAYHA